MRICCLKYVVSNPRSNKVSLVWGASESNFPLLYIYGNIAYVQMASAFTYRRIPCCLDADLEFSIGLFNNGSSKSVRLFLTLPWSC